MKQTKLLSVLKLPWIILFLTITSSCANVKIKNSEFCGDLGAYGAHCNQTLKDNPVDIAKKDWDEKRFGWICQSPQTFTDQKIAIEALCRQNKCTYEDAQKIQEIFAKILKMNKRSAYIQQLLSEEVYPSGLETK